MRQMALGDAAYGRVSTHLRDQIEIHSDDGRLEAMHAAAIAASQPAWSVPTTATSKCSMKDIARLFCGVCDRLA